ncbi:isomerase YbhE [Apiospora aurea]|uniref:Isomerase YbhE n=1 Tax=Apiospora aurea TaxID=335848 RepID=A0ABR1QLD0_9PEZI
MGQSVPGGAQMPRWLTYDPASKHVHILDENQGFPGYGIYCTQVTASRISGTGSFELLGQARTDGGDVHRSLYGGPDGRSFLAMAGYYTSSITTLELPLDQSSSEPAARVLPDVAAGPRSSRARALEYPRASDRDGCLFLTKTQTISTFARPCCTCGTTTCTRRSATTRRSGGF